MSQQLAKLQKLQASEAYRFHGTKVEGLKRLLPHQARDYNDRPEHNLVGVYAADKCVEAIFFALALRLDPSRRMNVQLCWEGGCLAVRACGAVNLTWRKAASLYVVDARHFTRHDSQHVSFCPVPVLMEFVIRADILDELSAANLLRLEL